MLGLFGSLPGCGGPRKGSQHNEGKEREERTSQRDRVSSSLIVSAYFMVSGCPKDVGRMRT